MISSFPLRLKPSKITMKTTQNSSTSSALQYWREQLEGSQPAEFLKDFKSCTNSNPTLRTTPLCLPINFRDSLLESCNATSVAPQDVLLAAFRATHYRLTGAADATIGLDSSDGIQFLRLVIDDGTTIGELVKHTSVATDDAGRHKYPYTELYREAHSLRTGFKFHKVENEDENSRLPGSEQLVLRVPEFQLQLQVALSPNGLQGSICYDSSLFHAASIHSIISTLQDILGQVFLDTSCLVDCIPLQNGLLELNRMGLSQAPTSTYSRDAGIPTLFKQQVCLSKHKIAVKDSTGAEWTYEQLDNESELLARKLRQRALPAESIVGVLAPRSNMAIAALLAILKAGLAYLPLDVYAPKGRVADILSLHSGKTLVLVGDGQLVPNVGPDDAEFVFLSDLRASAETLAIPHHTEPSATNLAYVMYTSGSTGRPKGVMIEHRGIVRLVKNTNIISPDLASGVMAHVGNLVFDASTWEIFTALLNGGTLICIDYMTMLDMEALYRVFRNERIQAALLTPAFLKQCLAVKEELIFELDILLVGGDRFDPHDATRVRSLLKPEALLINACGPAENTVASVVFSMKRGEECINGTPVGSSVTNSGAFVMDSQQNMVGPGVMGELVVTGDGLARGYTNPELNKGRFITLDINGVQTRAYRTGDRVRQRPTDGEMEFFGRLDNQVKIRGHRVELAEIDQVLLNQPEVTDAITLTRNRNSTGIELVSFVTITSAGSDDDGAAQDHVKNWGDVFDSSAYGGIGSMDLKSIGRDFTAWTSMYDGKLIDVGEMNEWLDDTITTIMEYQPKKVLELGFGTGMILFNICNEIESYVGIDPSNSAVEFVSNIVKEQVGLRDRVEVHCASASEAARFATSNAPDTVIINSVAQYFPSCEYLANLVEMLLQIESVQRIFFGDVRSYALYEEFRIERAMHEFDMIATKQQLRRRISELEDVEEEFLVDPVFFTSLTEKLPEQVHHVEILPKRMQTTNELSCYRYSAVIHTAKSTCQPLTVEEAWNDYIGEKLDGHQVERLLQTGTSKQLGICNIPNSMIKCAKYIKESLENGSYSANDVINWQTVEEQLPPSAMSPFNLVRLAEKHGYRVELSYARQTGNCGQIDAVFYKSKDKHYYRFPTHPGRNNQKIATSPVQQRQIQDTAIKLHSTLQNSLPSYMIPTSIQVLESMPVNSNGKVDRKALAKIAVDVMPLVRQPAKASVPNTELERFLCSELGTLLDVEVGLHDNFFDLGGHSLIAMQLVSRINQKLNIQATVGDVFSLPVIIELTTHLEHRVGFSAYSAITPQEHKGRVEQSFAQTRLFFLERLYPDSDWYLIPLVLRMRGDLDLQALRRALLLIEQRHEPLRTTFEEHDGQCFQIVRSNTPHQVEVEPVNSASELLKHLEIVQRKPFNIDTEPGWRINLYQMGHSEFTLSIVMHHIISDGWSTELLKRELATFYNMIRGGTDPSSVVKPLPVQYRDFTLWQNQPSQGIEHDKQLRYWKKILAKSNPATFLYDSARPAVPSGVAATHDFCIDGELYESLQAFCKANRVTPYVALFAAFRATHFRLTGNIDATIGTPAANRNRQELEGLIGFFVNMQCIRSEVNKHSYAALVRQLMKSTSDALINQDLPFERLVAELMQEGRDISRNPLVQIVFAFHERQTQDAIKFDNLDVEYTETLHSTRFDLEFHVFHEKNRLRGSIVYAKDLLDSSTVSLISDLFQKILHESFANPDVPIAEIPLLQQTTNGTTPGKLAVCGSNELIVDASNNPVPRAVVGELVVLCNASCPSHVENNSVVIQTGSQSLTAYRTGEYARYRPTDGEIELVHRDNGQIEGSHFEVGIAESELAEVEDLLQQNEQITGSVAVLRNLEGREGTQLVVFVALSGSAGPDEDLIATRLDATLEGHLYSVLRTALPTYMPPVTLIAVNKLPIQGNREALASMDLASHLTSRTRTTVAPKNAIETALCQFFAEVLGASVGTSDNFFHLGGHSLLGVRLVSRINKALDVDISVRELFTYPVIADLAAYVAPRYRSKYVSIPRVELNGPVEQSFAQGRLWFLDQLYPDSTRYIIPLAMRLRGALQVDALRLAIAAVEQRHETLRTIFEDHDGTSMQIVHPYRQNLATVTELSSWDEVVQRLRHDHAQPFDLTKSPGWRVEILRLSDTDHVLSIVLHHIIGDGWSVDVLQRDIAAFYTASLAGKGLHEALRPLPIQYRDFSVWQRTDAQLKQHEEQLEYWKTQLEDSHPASFLCDKIRPKVLSGKATPTQMSITGTLYSKLQQFCKEYQTTVFVVLLAAFRISHFRLTGAVDATIGTPIANRNRHELEDLIGFFVNLQCLRTKIDPEETTFAQLVQQVGDVSSQAAANQDIPFERIVTEMLRDHRDLSRNPLTQIAFAVHSQKHLGRLSIEGLQAEQVNEETTTRFDLELHFFQETDYLQGLLVHSDDLFFQETITSLLDIFQEVLQIGLENPDTLVATMSLEKNLGSLDQFGLAHFRQSKYPRDESIPSLFRQQASLSGNAIAVTDSDKQMTYTQLDGYSDLVAQKLINRQLPAETLIGTLIPRCCEAVVAFLGILKANLAYLPLDINAPATRTSSILAELPEGAIVLVGPGIETPNTDKYFEFVSIHSLYSNLEPLPDTASWITPSATSLAYVMYTSGSTGKPKGILAEHRGIVRLVKNTNVASPSQAAGIVAHMSNLAFDAATWEIYTALLNGGQVVCIDYMTVLDFPRLSHAFTQYRITAAFITVALLRQILSRCPVILESLDLVLSGGETMPVQDAIQAQSLVRGDFYNVYGPTENTSYSTLYRVPATETGVNGVPIGRTISHSGAFVMDSQQQLVPLGVIGELVVVGDGLSRGYTDCELNQGRFFSAHIGGQHMKAYRTGDLVRYRVSDGELEFFGRLDNQIKIRGHRVELPEIEHTLRQHATVADSAVVAINQGADMQLVSFVTLRTDDVMTESDNSGQDTQVENWATLFDADVYANLQSIDQSELGRDFTGWKSMYTKELIDKQEMSEWLDDTIATINMAGKPERVLEIGSGTGMILFNLDTELKSYIGLDPSAAAVNFTMQMSNHVESLKGRVQVKIGAANEVCSLYANHTADVAVINSVAQYFPSSAYLRALTEDLLRFDGMKRVFFGDIRSFALYREFGATKALYDLGETASKREIMRELSNIEKSEEELLVDPAFFTGLAEALPDLIAHVEIVPKCMEATNELSCYRYAAIIQTTHENHTIQEIEDSSWVDYQEKKLDRHSLEKLLANSANLVAVSRIPYGKIALERALLNALDDDSESQDWISNIQASLKPELGLSPFEIAKIASKAGYKVRLSWARQRTQQGAFDAVFYRMEEEYPLFRFPTDHNERSFRAYTNQPMQWQESNRIEQELRAFVQRALPSYMIPSQIHVLDEMPLNTNKKANRKKLVAMSLALTTDTVARDLVEPRNETQRRACECFSSVLGGIPVGITDSFFDIGGHSLLAMRLLAKLNSSLGWTLSVRDIYQYPTPELLCRADKLRQGHEMFEVYSRPESKATIVLVHAFMGQGGVYSDLRDMLDDCLDMITIHDPFFARTDGPLTVKEVARLYTEELKNVLSVEKPVFLCGYSYGGLVALDMAAMWQETFGKPLTSLIELDPGPYEPITVTDEVMEEEIEYGRHLFGRENDEFTMLQLQKLAPLFASLKTVPQYDGIGLYIPTLEAKDGGAMTWWNSRFPKLHTKLVIAPHNTMIEAATVGEVAAVFNEHILGVLSKMEK